MASMNSINEQAFGRSDLIRPSEAHYILVSGNRSFVPIEIGFIVPEGYGGREKFEEDMTASIKKIKGVAELRKHKRTPKK